MKKMRIPIDASMILLLPLLMAYSLISEEIHEYLGLAMAFLFLCHHSINFRWWKALLKGKYDASRIYRTLIDVLLVVYMILQPLSGILMSRYVLKTVAFGSSFLWRSLHMTLAYWGFVLVSMHLGLHGKMIGSMLHLNEKTKKILFILLILAGVYGAYVFYKRNFVDYLLMKTMFAYIDLTESRIVHFLDHLSVIVSFALIGYEIDEILKKGRRG